MQTYRLFTLVDTGIIAVVDNGLSQAGKYGFNDIEKKGYDPTSSYLF